MTNINDYSLSLKLNEDGSQEFRLEIQSAQKLFHGVAVDSKVTKILNCNMLYEDLSKIKEILKEALLITME